MKPWQKLTDIMGDANIADEMSKKYKGTVLAITDYDSGRVTYAVYNGIDGEHEYHRLKDKQGYPIKLSIDTQYDVWIPDPPKGMYNTKEGAVYFYRKPFRQHKRGLGEGTACVEKLGAVIGAELSHNYFEGLIFDVLEDEKVRSVTLATAFKLAELRNSAAINRTFAICLHPHKETGYALFYEKYMIGEIDEEVIRLGNPAFKQEIIDTQHTWCPNHKIEVMQ